MPRGAITLDLASDGVPDFLADFDLLVLWESLRRIRAPAGVAQVAAVAGMSPSSARTSLERLAALGVVEQASSGPRRGRRYRALRGPLLVTYDPSDPKTAFRLADARTALLGHLRRLGEARPTRASRKGSGWRRETFAALALDGEALDAVRAGIDRMEACAGSAAERSRLPAQSGADRRPRYRVHIAVEPLESREVSLPVVMLMERSDAAGRPARPSAIGSLSARGREIAIALAAGKTKREVAQSLGLAFATVNTLAVRAYRKLGVTRRAQLANALVGMC